jgi:hypothetical protein
MDRACGTLAGDQKYEYIQNSGQETLRQDSIWKSVPIIARGKKQNHVRLEFFTAVESYQCFIGTRCKHR